MAAALLAVGASTAALAATEPACSSLTPALVGGPVPSPSSDTVVMRWLGTSNYEVAWRGKVFLFDTFYERPGRTRPIGFTVDQVRRADVIFIGHGHFDHISDIAAVAKQTRALVVGAPLSIATAIRLGVPGSQTRVVKGGETFSLDGVTVRAALARHSTIQDGLTAAHQRMYEVDSLGPLTPAQEEEAKAIRARGTFDPHVIDEGTIGYALTLPGGFSIVVFDTAGPITDGDRALAKQIGRADILTVPYQPHPVGEHQVRDSWPFVETFNPRLVLPTHHDAIWNAWLDLGLEPLFEKLRDERPAVKFASPLLRSAICVTAAGPRRGTLAIRY